jgi:hypothetical protein
MEQKSRTNEEIYDDWKEFIQKRNVVISKSSFGSARSDR